MCRNSCQNRSWHHWGIMWWCPNNVMDFRWWHLCQYWKGIKGGCKRGGGFQFQVSIPVSSSRVQVFKLRAQVNLLQSTSIHLHTGLARNFYIKATILCLVSCFIAVIHFYLSRHQFLLTFLAWMAIELVYPATSTRLPDKDHYLISADRG